jgi:hypothetical protein
VSKTKRCDICGRAIHEWEAYPAQPAPAALVADRPTLSEATVACGACLDNWKRRGLVTQRELESRVQELEG